MNKKFLVIVLLSLFLISVVSAYIFDSVANVYKVDTGKEVVNVSNVSYSKGVVSVVVEKADTRRGLTMGEVIALKDASKLIQNNISGKVNVYTLTVIVQKPVVVSVREDSKDEPLDLIKK